MTLITRPRRLGKTLNMNMLEKFFSVRYAGRGDLFEGLGIWENEEYRNLQGTYPVISVSFANVKEKNYKMAVKRISQILTNLYSEYRFLVQDGGLDEKETRFFSSVDVNMDETVESGLGRYDIMMEPGEAGADAFIIEFKVAHTTKGETLEEAVQAALKQIENKKYDAVLRQRGILPERLLEDSADIRGCPHR